MKKYLRQFGLAALVLLLAFSSFHQPENPATEPDLSQLFDPLTLSQNLCGGASGMADTFTWGPVEIAAAAEEPVAKTSRSPHMDGLGDAHYRITTSIPEAQAFFDQGLRLVYDFNPGEAVASFRAASDLDPKCAMCFWGEALALGPNLNGPMRAEDIPVAIEAAKIAKALSSNTTAAEQALIGAVATRYSAEKDVKREDLDIAYANAMAEVYASHKKDSEIATLYADAAMEVRSVPWRQPWDKTGRYPQGYWAKAIVVLEDALPRYPRHAGLIHLYIHAMDGSATIKKAEPYADKLAALVPKGGHMVHMPAHTLFSLGRYKDSLATNLIAIKADEDYLSRPVAANDIYRFGLYPHNVSYALASAEMVGDAAVGKELTVKLKTHLDQRKTLSEGYLSDYMHAVVAFGTPEEILALQEPPKDKPYVTGIWHYARGTAYARMGDMTNALAEADALVALNDPRNEKAFGNFKEMSIAMTTAEHMLRGRVDAFQGKWAEAATHFQKAAETEDDSFIKDPPSWVFPVRQALGVALLRQGKTLAAEEALRRALFDAPSSGYALYALQEVSKVQKDETALREYGKLFEKAWAGTTPPDLDHM